MATESEGAVTLRCTAKALAFLKPVSLVEIPPSEADWYLNLLWVERRKCLLLAHAGTLFSAFIPDVRKSEVDPIGPFVAVVIREHLRSEGLSEDLFGPLEEVRLARTASHRMLGFMNDMALHCQHAVDVAEGLRRLDTEELNRWLRRALHNRGGDYVTAMDLVASS
ncbi:MAG TPA: hypothetical protein VGB19_13030 [Actinomycetota bacterium]